MSKHPAFWFEEVKRRVGAMADGSLVDAGVSNEGVRFYQQHSQEEIGLISWDEIWMALKADLNRSRANMVKLAEALERYGEHDGDCPAKISTVQDCTCGLDKAISESLHGPLNESAPQKEPPSQLRAQVPERFKGLGEPRILPVEDDVKICKEKPTESWERLGRYRP